MTPKLYYYVDETGQDTAAQPEKKRAIFVVAIVIVASGQSQLENLAAGYEKTSRKGKISWHKAKYSFRLDFIRSIIRDKRFKGTLWYQVFRQPSKPFFDAYTLQAIANCIGEEFKNLSYAKEIYVDGLTHSKQSEYAVELRRMGIRRATFHRATDQGSPLIRLADALAGLVRESEEGGVSEAAKVLNKGINLKTIRSQESSKKRKTTSRVVF